MQVLLAHNLSKSYGPRELFADISFGLGDREKVALVGANGSGKTTLLRILLGEIAPDAGQVQIPRGQTRLGYLPQATAWPDCCTLGEALRLPPGDPALTAEAAKRFGLAHYAQSHPVAQLSGGERTRLGLARLWMSQADLLLLDEPTAHLDMAGLRWLAEWVSGFPGAAIVVSHDRYFLDQVATRVLAIADGCLRSYAGNYTAYRQAWQSERESQMALYADQDRRTRQLREAIARQAQWAEQGHAEAREKGDTRSAWIYYRGKAKKLAKRGQAISRQLERLEAERVAKPKEEPRIRLAVRAEGRAGRDLIVAEGLSKAFDAPLLCDSSFVIRRGEKVGLVGPNGSGKTTLLRMIVGLEAGGGRLWLTPAARPAMLDQHAASLRDDWTVLAEIAELTGDQGQARNLLGSFLFGGERVMAQVGTLSGGA